METTGGLAPYRIEVEIAHSSICTIYRAHEESLDRPVLIKKLHPQMAREEDIRKRFEREAQVCARVKHENIVDIYSYRADAEATLLVMEFVEGESLGDLLKRQGRIDWQVALTMLFGVLSGLAHAHSKGVFHRDIKPDNLLVSKEGRVKITDFGLATIADAARMTVQDAIVGTPAYLPPEQVSGGKFDHRGDLFSVGVTFYETLTGSSPFSGQTFSETLKKILTYSPPAPSSLIPEIPVELDQILAGLLEKQPSRRTPSAESALEQVKRLAQMKGVNLVASTVKDSLQTAEDGSGSKTAVPLPPLRSRLTDKTIMVWGFGILAVLVAMMLFLVPTRSELVGDGLPKLKRSLIESARQIVTSAKSKRIDSTGNSTPSGIDESKQLNSRDDVGPVKVRSDPPNHQGNSGQQSVIDREPTRLRSTNPGKLALTSRPWAMVTIDNVSYGQTPLADAIQLTPGSHTVTLINSEFPTPYTGTVEIGPDSTTVLDVNLWDLVGQIRVLSVKPWAEIFVDGVSFGSTPRAKPIILTFGRHKVELRNPGFETWSQEFDLLPGKHIIELNIQLE